MIRQIKNVEYFTRQFAWVFQDCQWHKSQEKQGKEVGEIKKVKKKDTKCIAWLFTDLG